MRHLALFFEWERQVTQVLSQEHPVAARCSVAGCGRWRGQEIAGHAGEAGRW